MTHFAEFIIELLRPWREVRARRMFGGQGLYHSDLMFALIAEGQLYLKIDAQSLPDFEAAGLAPFFYEAKGRRVALSYHRAPEAMLDDAELARAWAERGWQAALRAQEIRNPRRKTVPAKKARPAPRGRSA